MEIEASEARRQVERLLASKALEGTDVHRRLLSYLSEKTLAGEADRLKEYVVALDALGKPATYDPRHDSVVRIQIGRLRSKLAEYYQKEGAGDPILVTLPKGSFKLEFEKAAPHSEGPRTARGNRLALALAVALVLVAAWAGWATWRLRALTDAANVNWTRDMAQLWAPFLESPRPLVVCIGVPMFLKYPALAFVRDPGANTWEDLDKSPRYAIIKKGFAGYEPSPWYAYTGVGEASGLFQLGTLLGSRRRNILVTRSNLLSWEEAANTELVFLGPPKFNTQLQSILAQQEITLETNGIRVRNPGPGEAAFYEDQFLSRSESDGITHGLISCTPGLSGQGAILILGGNASSDSYAATQWVTQPWRVRELVGHLRLASGAMPRYYQAVIRVRFKNGTPVESNYVLHRVLNVADSGAHQK